MAKAAKTSEEHTKNKGSNLRRIWFPRHTFILPHELESMLEHAELEGWCPTKMGSVCLSLQPSEPKKVCYVCEAGKPSAPHQDHGWEFAGKIGSVRLWKREYSGAKPRSFAESDTLVKMIRNAVYSVCVTFIASSMLCVLMVAFALILHTILPLWAFPLLLGGGLVCLLVAILYGRAFQKLCKTVEKMEDAVKRSK